MNKKSHLGLVGKLVNLMQKDWISGVGWTKMSEEDTNSKLIFKVLGLYIY